MKQALINILNAIAERIRPCKHKWNLEYHCNVATDFGGRYASFTYCCDKCGKFKRIKSNNG